MRNYAADDADRRYRSTELVGRFADFQLPTIATWHATTDGRHRVAEPMTTVRLDVLGGDDPPNVEVLPLTAMETDWLDPGGPPIRSIPVGRL